MKKSVSIAGLLSVALAIGSVVPRSVAQETASIRDARVQTISRQIALNPNSPALRRALAERYEELGLYSQASDAYSREAALRRQMGTPDLSVAVATEEKARRYATDVRIFQDRPATPEERNRLNTRARLEPATGCYVGAFIDRDDALKETYMDENFQTHRYAREFSGKTQHPHTSYFMYLAYRSYMIDGAKKEQVVPLRWLQQCKDDGIIPQIALEPHNFDEVRDDAYLKEFAQALGQLNWPIFVRFASEMNGKWTSWSTDPATYKAKFRLVHKTLHRYAPKVATIWCPNCVPVSTITDYYPGDDGCDWVGVNLYCVPFYNNDPSRPATNDAPTTLIDPIYNLYASRKPIAIGEWAASRETRLQGTPRAVDDFAMEKMALFYGALPRLYPRVKMVNWFDMDAIQHAVPGRQLNNYNLTEKPAFLASYRAAIQEPYFIKSLADLSDPTRPMPFPLRVGQVWDQPVALSIWAKSYVSRPRVTLDIGGKNVYSGRSFGVHRVSVDPQQFPVGPQRVVVRVYDDASRLVATESTLVEIRRGSMVVLAPTPTPAATPRLVPTPTAVPRVALPAPTPVPVAVATPTPTPVTTPTPTATPVPVKIPTPVPHPVIVSKPTLHPVTASTPKPRKTLRLGHTAKPRGTPKPPAKVAAPTLAELYNRIQGKLKNPNTPSKPVHIPAKGTLSDWLKQGRGALEELKKKPPPKLEMPLAPVGASPFADSPLIPSSLAAGAAPAALPVPISGIVQRYYANDVGIVTAMQVQTAGSQEVIFFPPAMAAQLTATSPVGTRIEAWLQPRPAGDKEGERTWNLVALGFEKPVANALKLSLKDGRTLLNQWRAQNTQKGMKVSGKITNVVHDMAGRALALVIDDKSLVYVPLRLRPSAAPKPGQTSKSPGLTIEVVGNGLTPPPGTRNLYTTVVEAQTIRTQGRAITGPEWSTIDRLPWKPAQMAVMAEGLEQNLVRVLNLQIFAGTLEDMMVRGNKPGSPAPSGSGKLSAHPVPEEIANETGKRPW